MNKLVEQLSAHALAAWDTENHFRAMAATGDARTGMVNRPVSRLSTSLLALIFSIAFCTSLTSTWW